MELVIVIAVSDPVCEVVQPAIKGHDAVLMCRMTYDWQSIDQSYNFLPGVDVTASWNDVSGTTVRTTADPEKYRGSVETNMTIANVNTDTIPSYTCSVEFQFTKGLSRFDQYAVNTLSSTCVSKPTKVWSK